MDDHHRMDRAERRRRARAEKKANRHLNHPPGHTYDPGAVMQLGTEADLYDNRRVSVSNTKLFGPTSMLVMNRIALIDADQP